MNGWRKVPRADAIPHSCAVLPQLGAGHAEGYIDTGIELATFDPRIYISVHAARQLGEFVGMVDPAPLENEIKRLGRELEEAQRRLAEFDKFEESVAYTLGHFGSKVRQKPGRKPVKEAA